MRAPYRFTELAMISSVLSRSRTAQARELMMRSRPPIRTSPIRMTVFLRLERASGQLYTRLDSTTWNRIHRIPNSPESSGFLLGRTHVPAGGHGHPDRDVLIGGRDLIMIAGPCAVESEKQLDIIASSVKRYGARILRGGPSSRAPPLHLPGPGERRACAICAAC